MIDRTTKLLLAAIAVGLFLNVAVPLVQPTPIMAQGSQEESEELLASPGTNTDNGLKIQITINSYIKFIPFIILAVPLFLGALYLLVRFIRWAWES